MSLLQEIEKNGLAFNEFNNHLTGLRNDIKLSTGRVVKHSIMDNGAQLATPTPGCYEMTNQEWIEYCKIINGGYIPRYPMQGEDLLK
jgi:hypothetical protein